MKTGYYWWRGIDGNWQVVEVYMHDERLFVGRISRDYNVPLDERHGEFGPKIKLPDDLAAAAKPID